MTNIATLFQANQGTTVPSGFIGETVSASFTNKVPSTSNVAFSVGTYTPSAGIYLVTGYVRFSHNATPAVGNSYVAVSVNTSTAMGVDYTVERTATSGVNAETTAFFQSTINTNGTQSYTLVAQLDFTTLNTAAINSGTIKFIRIA